MGRLVAVVDDDREIREVLSELLTEAGYEVIVVPNGLRLVSVLRVRRPDLILLDVMMSWIDGFELCRALKRNLDFRGIPIIFISGRGSAADVARGLSCGAVDYLVKPIDPRRLLDRVSLAMTTGDALSRTHLG